MNQIFKIFKNKFKSHKNLKISVMNNERVVLKRNFIFKIFVWESSKQMVNISFRWQLGVLGRIVFKNYFKEMNCLIEDIENTLKQENISSIKIIKNNK